MEGEGTTGLLIQLFPLIFMGAIYAVVVFFTARKRGVNPWPWTVASLIPAIGLIVSGVFMLLSWFAILDRLNRLERGIDGRRA